jgi:hypothetical protein
MTTISDILNRAADRLAQEGAWTQNALAKDDIGTQVPPRYATACQWCSKGAIRAETQNIYDQYRAELALRNVLDEPITVWNDNPARNQIEVVAAFRKAAAL